MSLSCVALVAACGGGEEDAIDDLLTITPMGGGTGMFGRFYMPDITDGWRTAAASFRNSARFQVQSGTIPTAGGAIFSNPLFSSRVDYAHAVGLSGAGQVIAVVDEGFRRTHEAFAGKTNTQTGDPEIDDHGTMVASIAAGNSREMVGVAPGADLLFSSWDAGDLAAAAIAARARGAVAQNNSWGFEDFPISQANYDNLFGDPDYSAWLDALKLYAQDGVVVFAISNNDDLGTANILEALPVIETSLERAWIAVGNTVPVFDDNGVTGVGQRFSAPCLETARWCLMADGFWYGASATSNSSYTTGTGSSFAAPQVAGALALLAEAFPDLTPHELRARLLASADNTFTGFVAAGTVDLLDGPETFNHAYSTEFGHGFLDIRAALLPIGTLSVAMADGRMVQAQDFGFSAGGAMGDAVARGLEGVDLAVRDAMGAGFGIAAKSFATSAEPEPLVAAVAARTLGKDFASARTGPISPLSRSFEAYSGQTLELSAPDGRSTAAVLLGGGESFGIALSRRVAEGVLKLDLGLKLARDDGSVMGFTDASGGGAKMAALTVSLSHDLGDGGFFALTGELGLAAMDRPRAFSSLSAAAFNSIGLDLGTRSLFARDDRLAIGLSMPVAVTSGEARMDVPVALGQGRSEVRSLSLDLAPSERQVDLSISYQMPMGVRSEFLLELVHAENYGNLAGVSDQAAVLGMKWEF